MLRIAHHILSRALEPTRNLGQQLGVGSGVQGCAPVARAKVGQHLPQPAEPVARRHLVALPVADRAQGDADALRQLALRESGALSGGSDLLSGRGHVRTLQ